MFWPIWALAHPFEAAADLIGLATPLIKYAGQEKLKEITDRIGDLPDGFQEWARTIFGRTPHLAEAGDDLRDFLEDTTDGGLGGVPKDELFRAFFKVIMAYGALNGPVKTLEIADNAPVRQGAVKWFVERFKNVPDFDLDAAVRIAKADKVTTEGVTTTAA